MALKYLIEFGYMAQRLSVYIVTSQLSIPYSFPVADLAMVPWVPWNPPYLAGLTISLVLKSTDC